MHSKRRIHRAEWKEVARDVLITCKAEKKMFEVGETG